MMDLLYLCLIVACYGPITSVRAQWVLDHRCTRNRRLELPHSSVIVSGSKDQMFQGVDPAALDMGHEVNNLGDNETDHSPQTVEEEGKYWYSNLRGKAQYAASTSTADKSVPSQSRRNLDNEETASFMLRLHWQPGYCWQGKEDAYVSVEDMTRPSWKCHHLTSLCFLLETMFLTAFT
jgi:hypothetical protein